MREAEEPSEPAPSPAAAPPPADSEIDRELMNRQMRRRYEKLRRKHDRLVTPKGTPPTPVVRAASAPRAREPKIEISDELLQKFTGPIIAWPHHDDQGNDAAEKVLYEAKEFEGLFTFRDTILQQLDRYWVYLRRMRRMDDDAYQFYRQVGALLVPYSSTGEWWQTNKDRVEDRGRLDKMQVKECKDTLPPWFLAERPGFGCIAYGINPVAEHRELEDSNGAKLVYMPKFLYFTKYKHPPARLQPMTGGDIYKMTVWWDRPHDPDARDRMKYGIPQDFGIFVGKNGKLRALKTYDRHRSAKTGKRDYWREWKISPTLELWARQHGISAERYLVHQFVDMVERYEVIGHSMVQINITKDDMHAIFSVPERRIAYFFKDRDYVLNEHGQRERVFHFVKPHKRITGALVKAHFRGAREFTWAGYNVLLTVPGLHHVSLLESGTLAAYDSDRKKMPGFVDAKQTGAFIANHIRTGT